MACDHQRLLIAATNNVHKIHEFSRLFSRYSLRSPSEVGQSLCYEESGRSYLENALGKAMHLYRLVRHPVLADDSGLEVAALGGEPGLYSSRYGSADGKTKLSDEDRNAYLLSRARGIEDRSCCFLCCMVVVIDEKRFVAVQETFSGLLAEEPAGSGGFGYDPIVYLPERGKTVAQLNNAEKDKISHRGKAARRILGLLETPGF